MCVHARIQKVCNRASNSDNVFFFFVFSYEGEGPKALHVKAGNHWHANETLFKLRFDDGLKLTRHGMLT